MPVITIAAAGTPQSLAGASLPAQPTINMQGVTSSIGGAQQFGQVIVQNPPGSVGNLYVGSKGMVKATLAGVDHILIPGESVTLGNGSTSIVLDQVWIDTDTNGNPVLYSAK